MATATKTRNSKPTARQKAAAVKVMENARKPKPETIGKVLQAVGYSRAVSETPTDVTESKGFKAALDELGLTDDLIVSSLVADIKGKPKRRLGELALAAKIRGLDRGGEVAPPAPITPGTTNTQNNFYLGGDEMRENYTKFVEEKTREIIEHDNA